MSPIKSRLSVNVYYYAVFSNTHSTSQPQANTSATKMGSNIGSMQLYYLEPNAFSNEENQDVHEFCLFKVDLSEWS